MFTYGGHFIVITGIEGNTLKVYDPYLYNGKFTTASRKKANVKVKGNTVYVSVDAFKKYANCKSFFSYKYNKNKVTNNNTTVVTKPNTNSNVKNVNYKAKVTAGIGLNIRNGASANYKILGAYRYGTTVTITKESNGWGKTNKGWICLDYVKKISSITSNKSNIKAGSKVILLTSAKKYATGQTIPAWCKNRKYTIMQIGSGKVLLKELYSWVYTKDIK